MGAEVQPKGGVHFRVWAPAARDVVVEFADHRRPLAPEPGERMTKEHSGGGYFSGWVDEAGAGMRYRFRLDSSSTALPDPASRAQPDGPHGDSVVVDPAAFAWNDGAWRGVPATQLVIYEMHIGTFTPEGSWAAATARLPALAELGVTCIEMMPVAEFSGCFGWGYDGVDLFAPTRLYGEPDDLRRFVDRAHGLGLAVILDVVYNHMGPDGNYLRSFAPAYFTDRYVTEWGEALNFDGPDAGPVREFFVANAGYWIDEYHFDGLRLDATHRICDASDEHVLAAIARRVRAAANGRSTFVVAENEDQVARLVRSREQGGYGLDAVWNDDFHHAARVALTGRREGYYRDFSGRPGEFVALAKHGFLFQGQRPTPEVPPRGTPSRDLPPSAFVVCLENHDQIAHSGAGRRGHQLSHPGSWRALTAFLLLNSAIPMLFQGQEFGASAPFLYFADYPSELGGLITKGRREFLAQFASLASPEMQAALADPVAPETFRRCVLDHDERRCERHAEMVALHRDLLALRRDDSAFRGRANRIDGAVLSDDAWLLRYFADDGSDRLLIFNIGRDLLLDPPSEPLLAPVAGGGWHLRWSSEAPRYGGTGIPEPIIDGVWRIAGHAAVLLTAKMPVS
ncbi:MAG TPA: malto-oligosyltrehalose trehalohydrolase [Stellaceae bacterium]|nr:malto-oligosyltrehalose trehalohydrolase [Stellaceae bacterium]